MDESNLKVNENNLKMEGNILKKEENNLIKDKNNLKKVIHQNLKSRKIIYYFLGVLEVLFTFRLVFKILGANPESNFVAVIYSVTNLFLAPFIGIFRVAVSKGIETQAILEPTLVIAMIVYAALAWGIVKLIEIASIKGSEAL